MVNATSTTAAPAQRGINSVEIAGRILAALIDMPRPVRLTDLAHQVGLPSAKLHRYLTSLRRTGLVGQDASGRYDFGLLARRIAAKYAAAQAVDVALPFARELSAKLSETVMVAELGPDGPVSMRHAVPDLPVSILPRMGSVHSLTGSATGRVFAAWLPEGEREALLARELKALPPKRREAERRRFERTLDEVRRRGVGFSQGERIPGINAISAPVFDAAGRVVLAITVIGNAATFTPAVDASVERSLKEAAAAVSRRLSEIP